MQPEAFWRLTDSTPADYLTEQGVDVDRVKLDATEIANKFGLIDLKARGPVVPSQKGGEYGQHLTKRNSFVSAFKPRDADE